jgi:hypothetical protein
LRAETCAGCWRQPGNQTSRAEQARSRAHPWPAHVWSPLPLLLPDCQRERERESKEPLPSPPPPPPPPPSPLQLPFAVTLLHVAGEGAKPAVFLGLLAYLLFHPGPPPHMVQAHDISCAPEALCSVASFARNAPLLPFAPPPTPAAISTTVPPLGFPHPLIWLWLWLWLPTSLPLCLSVSSSGTVPLTVARPAPAPCLLSLRTHSATSPLPASLRPAFRNTALLLPHRPPALATCLAFHCMPTPAFNRRPLPLRFAPGCL